MTLGKLARYLGFFMALYAILSSFYFIYTSNDFDSSFESGFSFKLGSFLLGLLLIYFGKRLDAN